MKTALNFVTFSSSNWTESPKRYAEQLKVIDDETNVFKKSFIFNERDLGKEYNKRFSKYFSDHGFAYWSWKPLAILEAMKRIEKNELLFYMDGGCTFPMDNLKSFVTELVNACEDFEKSQAFVGLTSFNERPWPQFPGFPNITIVKREILDEFGLRNNDEFLFKFPHWQSGLILLKNNSETIEFLKEWYVFFLNCYELCVRGGFEDKQGQHEMFIRNNSDQAILQCMLFIKKTKIFPMNFIYKYRIIEHLRK